MSKKLLYILLLISLAFNLAFVGTFIYFRATHPKPHWEDSRRDRHDHQDRDKYRIEDSDSTRALRDSFRSIKKELMLELAKETIDEAAINSIIQRSLQAQAVLESDLGKRLIILRKSMTSQEAKEHFMDRIKRMDERKERREDKQRRRNRR